MTLLCLLFCSGIIVAGYFSALPPPVLFYSAVISLIIIQLLLRRPAPWLRYCSAVALGMAYGVTCGYFILQNQLPENLAGRDIFVEGKVQGLPQEDERRQLFILKVNRASLNGDPLTQFPKLLSLSSYSDLRVKPGEQWRLKVKLKVPRGFVNPGGFDYQAYLIRRGIGATGYVKPDNENLLLQTQPGFSIDVLRYQLQQWLINSSTSPHKSILVALLVGDTSLVDKAHWGEMIKTGTNHLIAISGLHLGFFAIVGFFVGNFIGRFVQIAWHRCPAYLIGVVFSLGFTLFYSFIAGLNIPTLRTLIMLAVVQIALVLGRLFRTRDALLLALILVLLYDPLAAYDMGFWLSFCAVGMLLFCFSGRKPVNTQATFKKRLLFSFIEFLKSQWVMFVGLLIPLAILIHSSSLLAPAANFLAIPVITFFVVPCLILAALCHYFFAMDGSLFLLAAEMGLDVVHRWLEFLLSAGAGKLNPLINLNPWALGLAALGVLLLLAPKGISHKPLGILGLLFALLIPLAPARDLQMLVFDVGQGTAVLIRTPNHQLIYDTGPQYTENFDAGSGIITPYLQGQGISSVDAIIVSHNDQDHSGGLAGLLSTTMTGHLWLGEPEKHRTAQGQPEGENCHSINPWRWDDVEFQFLTWPQEATAKANNHSCVLLLSYAGQRILLTGDIEKEVERKLLAQNSIPKTDILFAPHHGSHTSSTPGFVAQAQPGLVIYSAGFHNQHGHPHQDVRDRYVNVRAKELNTAYTGALEFNWYKGEPLSVICYREKHQRYWFSLTSDRYDKN